MARKWMTHPPKEASEFPLKKRQRPCRALGPGVGMLFVPASGEERPQNSEKRSVGFIYCELVTLRRSSFEPLSGRAHPPLLPQRDNFVIASRHNSRIHLTFGSGRLQKRPGFAPGGTAEPWTTKRAAVGERRRPMELDVRLLMVWPFPFSLFCSLLSWANATPNIGLPCRV